MSLVARLLLGLSFVALGAFARGQDAVEPLDEASAGELRAALAQATQPAAPGGILAVLRRGEPCFVQPFGLAELERHEPITRTTIFYLASVAKQFTAACVLHAAAAGKLALDEPITKRVSGLPASYGAVRIVNLVEHRGGVPDIYDLAIGLDLGRAALASNASALALLRKLPQLDFTPGTRFRYSNSGYVLLAEALGVATQSSLAAYARANLFAPLGMKSAHFNGDAELAKLPRARSYHRAGDAWEALEITTGLIGPGGMWASLDDLARWERAAFEGGFGDAALRARLVQPPVLGPLAWLHPTLGAYGAGVMLNTDRGLPVVRSAGEAFGFQAEILRYPEQELSIVVFANADLELDNLAEDTAGVVLREEFRAAREASARDASSSARATPADLARFGRFWREEDSGVLWVLSLKPERMLVTSLGDWKFELAYAGPARLVSRDTRAPAEFVFEPASGPATRMLVRSGGVEVARCRPHPFPPAQRAELDELAGEYTLTALGVTIRLQAVQGGLQLAQPHALGPNYVLPPFQALGEDFFACDAGACLQFHRDAAGELTGLRMDVNRASALELVRR
ncbi:MAG: class A beta-lactamase-related serine hydrolase [Planctomycetes bacterium]|nr:class A beta-lactamase-related serine hydrolase [Planctomycetota bacterium]